MESQGVMKIVSNTTPFVEWQSGMIVSFRLVVCTLCTSSQSMAQKPKDRAGGEGLGLHHIRQSPIATFYLV